MKTLLIVSITAWVTVIAHNHIIDNDVNYYRFKKTSIETVCAIHKFYKELEGA